MPDLSLTPYIQAADGVYPGTALLANLPAGVASHHVTGSIVIIGVEIEDPRQSAG
jgi:hypothetical protein